MLIDFQVSASFGVLGKHPRHGGSNSIDGKILLQKADSVEGGVFVAI